MGQALVLQQAQAICSTTRVRKRCCPAGWQGTQRSASGCRHRAHSWARKLSAQAATLLLHTAKRLPGCRIDAVLDVRRAQHQSSSCHSFNIRHGPTALSKQHQMSAKQLLGSACVAPDASDAQVWGGGAPGRGCCLTPHGQCGPALRPNRWGAGRQLLGPPLPCTQGRGWHGGTAYAWRQQVCWRRSPSSPLPCRHSTS